jgi:O-antigen/teichoic acid export membrane protein
LGETGDQAMKDLKQRAIRGGFAKMCAQGANFSLRIISLMVLARLLDPKDFGLVGMVTAITGVLSLFRDFGLSSASVQRADVTDHQVSTLFWINMFVGTALWLVLSAASSFVAGFYHEPRLLPVTLVLATGFLFNALGIQHSARLQRNMRFTVLSSIDILSLILSIAVGIGMAALGYGYWALVAMTLTSPIVCTICFWLATSWVPGPPRKQSGTRSLLRFGGTMTLNGLVVYVAYNFEKVLLGRYWGAAAIGIYGRAYQLINIPTDNLNSSVGEVAFSALSRLQGEPHRLKSYFLKGYAFVLALTLPVTIFCAVFAPSLIAVVLGPKWTGAVPIFRLLAPTMLSFALINPFGWLLFSTGRVERSLKIALVIAPLVITAYVAGLPFGPKGVALAYSIAMVIWIVPHIVWCVHGTVISFKDVMVAISKPVLSAAAAGAVVLPFQYLYLVQFSALLQLIAGGAVLFGVYVWMLLYVMGQKEFYLELLRGLKSRPAAVDKALVPA